MITPSCGILYRKDSHRRVQALWKTYSAKDSNSYTLFCCGEKRNDESFKLETTLKIIESDH